MRKLLLSIGISLLVVHGAYAADDSILKPDHPDQYIVKKGDTLWDIANMFLTDAWLWPQIWHINPDIKNPDLIYPGDTIVLTFVGGKPQLSVQRGDEGRTTKLSPAPQSENVKLEPQVRATPLTSAIPAIPLDAIAGLLKTGRIVEKDTLEKAPHIVAGHSARLIFGPGDDFYARGNWEAHTQVYGIYRKGDVYRDPETRKIVGYEAREIGTASVVKRGNDLYTLQVQTVNEGVRVGDRLLPTEERRVESMFYPSAPNRDVKGLVMSVIGDVSLAGRNDIVALNRGEEQGLAVGNVLAINKHGSVVRDPVERDRVKLPSERIGLLMVFRTFPKMSYGLILQTDEPINVGDIVQNP